MQRVVLFLSGEQGWNAQALAQRAAARVAGRAGRRHRFARAVREPGEATAPQCVYPDGDLENLSHFLQAYYRLPSYEPACWSATVRARRWATRCWRRRPRRHFAGARLDRLLSRAAAAQAPVRSGHVAFRRSPKKQPRRAADAGEARSAVDRVQTRPAGALRQSGRSDSSSAAPDSATVMLPQRRQTRELEAALSRGRAPSRPPPTKRRRRRRRSSAGLPIVEVPAQAAGDTLAVLISGDGGWAGIDKAVAAALAEQGIAVVGVDSLRYFWKERTPESTAADIDRILRHYLEAWDKKDVVLIGYSQGADILPFVVNRLPAHTRSRVRLAAMLGLGERATFEFHLANWLSGHDEDESCRSRRS